MQRLQGLNLFIGWRVSVNVEVVWAIGGGFWKKCSCWFWVKNGGGSGHTSRLYWELVGVKKIRSREGLRELGVCEFKILKYIHTM